MFNINFGLCDLPSKKIKKMGLCTLGHFGGSYDPNKKKCLERFKNFLGMVWSDFVDFLTLSEHTGDFEVSLAGLLDAVLCIIKHSMMKILFNN